MKVTKHTEKTFEVVLTDSESKQLKDIAVITKSKDEVILEHLLSSGMFHAVDAFHNLLSDVKAKEVDDDGNEIG